MKTGIKMFIVGVLTLLVCSIAYAKIVDLEMEFSMDPEFVPYIDSYKLYSEVPESGNLVLIDNLPNTTPFTFQVTALDLPPGQITNFYISAVYGTDANALEDISLAKPFKYTGKPVWIRINKG